MTDVVTGRFWKKVVRGDPADCWEWQAFVDSNGYGRIYVEKRKWLAHRFSYMLVNGRIPEGMFVCHTCDNPPCVNPAHLFLGTRQDNIDDMTRKGRQAKGERNGQAKLTARQVLEMKQLFLAGGYTQKQLGARYEVSGGTVDAVLTGRTWAKVGPDIPEKFKRLRGERGGKTNAARLTETAVLDLRAEYAAGGVTQKALGQKYNIKPGTVWKIVNRRSWRHI